jgi:hypothetical protein
MTTDKVLDKLSKLKAAQDGEARLGNSAAAEAFAGAINRLLLQHELSEVDIPLGGVKDDPIVEVLVNLWAHGIKRSRVRVGWQEALAQIVAEAHLCKFLVTPGTNNITLVGTKAHATVAEYAYGVLAASADRMSKDARNVYWRENRDEPDFEAGNFRAAWINGFVGRIAERFREARQAEVRATGNASTALIRLDQALVRSQSYVKERYTGKASAVHMAGGCSEGRAAGRAAADGIALGRKGVDAKRQKAIR